MYICIYIHKYEHIHTYIYICVYVCTNTYIDLHGALSDPPSTVPDLTRMWEFLTPLYGAPTLHEWGKFLTPRNNNNTDTQNTNTHTHAHTTQTHQHQKQDGGECAPAE